MDRCQISLMRFSIDGDRPLATFGNPAPVLRCRVSEYAPSTPRRPRTSAIAKTHGSGSRSSGLPRSRRVIVPSSRSLGETVSRPTRVSSRTAAPMVRSRNVSDATDFSRPSNDRMRVIRVIWQLRFGSCSDVREHADLSEPAGAVRSRSKHRAGAAAVSSSVSQRHEPSETADGPPHLWVSRRGHPPPHAPHRVPTTARERAIASSKPASARTSIHAASRRHTMVAGRKNAPPSASPESRRARPPVTSCLRPPSARAHWRRLRGGSPGLC